MGDEIIGDGMGDATAHCVDLAVTIGHEPCDLVELGMVDLAESGLQVAKDRIGKAVEHVGFRHPARPAVMLHQW